MLREPSTPDAPLPDGHADLDAVSGDRVTVLANASAPPGAPLQLVCGARVFEGRVRSCQRASASSYRIEFRLVNLSKPARLELEALMARSRPPD
ncbi:MAG TPA: hypothetical protein VI197_06535 [Polyangiaceae bacterium]